MIHGPCGVLDPTSPCMEKKSCTKNFPKPFQATTIVDGKTSHPFYRRRSPEQGGGTTQKKGKPVDNSWVVPYNPYLTIAIST